MAIKDHVVQLRFAMKLGTRTGTEVQCFAPKVLMAELWRKSREALASAQQKLTDPAESEISWAEEIDPDSNDSVDLNPSPVGELSCVGLGSPFFLMSVEQLGTRNFLGGMKTTVPPTANSQFICTRVRLEKPSCVGLGAPVHP